MAISVLILGPDDVLQADDWVRPLVPTCGEFMGNEPPINSFSTYGGTPQNHLRWVAAQDVIGKCWMGKALRDINKAWDKTGGFNYEVVRGPVPMNHVWDWRKEHHS